MKHAGDLRFKFEVNEHGRLKSRIDFWDDLLHDVAFSVEPKAAIIQPYSAAKFTTLLYRTEKVGIHYALATGQIGYFDETITQAASSALQASDSSIGGGSADGGSVKVGSVISAASATTGTGTNTNTAASIVMEENKTILMLMKGDIFHPSIRLEKHVIEAPIYNTIAPENVLISLKAQAPLLFASGQKPSTVCWKSVTLTNPLDATVTFSVTTEGPFTLKSAVDDSHAKAADDKRSSNKKAIAGSAATAASAVLMSSSATVSTTTTSNSSSMGRAFCLLPQVIITYHIYFS
jgi:hypothetical protein